MVQWIAIPLLLVAAAAPAADSPGDLWAEILRTRVNAGGEVAYRTLAKLDGERIARYLASLAAVEPSRMSHDAAVAFWINAYNAMVVFAVIHGETPDSLPARARMFHWFRLEIAGPRRTIDEVHEILERYAGADPRIHFALCNATRGAPRLALAPYRADELDAALASAAREFANDPRRNRIDTVGRRARLSRLFDWYRADFERAGGSLTGYLKPLLRDSQAAEVIAGRNAAIDFLDFDWSLNAAPRESPS